ncbi:MAG: hypothetical protein H0X45_04450 [Planctomycetes bacterium]|nr:hypothetical protein [Planctomycetota bacterium]
MRPRPIQLLLTLLTIAATGCIEHRAQVRNPEGEGAAGAAAIGVAVVDPFAAGSVHTVSDPLPRDLGVAAWVQGEDDSIIRRWHGRSRTPLPWWQRFPVDIAAEAWPATLICAAETTVAVTPVASGDSDALLAAARRDGYLTAAPKPEPTTSPAPQESR